MTPDRLINIAQAHGLTFDHIGGGGRPSYTVAEVGMALGGLSCGQWWNPDSENAMRSLLCSPTEPCNACQLERERCYAAFAWREISDPQQRSRLYSHLVHEVFMGYASRDPKHVPVSMREGWPEKIAGRPYMDKLIVLAIAEDRMARHADEPHPISTEHPMFERVLASYGFKDINEFLWRRRLERRYVAIRHIIMTWYAVAWHAAAEKLSER